MATDIKLKSWHGWEAPARYNVQDSIDYVIDRHERRFGETPATIVVNEHFPDVMLPTGTELVRYIPAMHAGQGIVPATFGCQTFWTLEPEGVQ